MAVQQRTLQDVYKDLDALLNDKAWIEKYSLSIQKLTNEILHLKGIIESGNEYTQGQFVLCAFESIRTGLRLVTGNKYLSFSRITKTAHPTTFRNSKTGVISMSVIVGYNAYINALRDLGYNVSLGVVRGNEIDSFSDITTSEKGRVIEFRKKNYSEILDSSQDIVCYYATISKKDANGDFFSWAEVFNMETINKRKNASKGKDTFWKTWFFEMCRKTPLLSLCRTQFSDILADMYEIDAEAQLDYIGDIPEGTNTETGLNQNMLQREVNFYNLIDDLRMEYSLEGAMRKLGQEMIDDFKKAKSLADFDFIYAYHLYRLQMCLPTKVEDYKTKVETVIKPIFVANLLKEEQQAAAEAKTNE